MPCTLAQPTAIERDQALPVPLGRRLVVDLELRKGETVMDAVAKLVDARHSKCRSQKECGPISTARTISPLPDRYRAG
jgi:hypothetical protein